MEGQAQNKTEEATPFKLRRAREKGQVARGMDVGFVGSLVALSLFATLAGQGFVAVLAQAMQWTLTSGMSRA
jgi:flagellar biosynthetic protein FlhB